MMLHTKLMRSLVSKILNKAIKKKCGCQIDIQIKSLTLNIREDGTTKLSLDVDAEMPTSELKNIIAEHGF